MTAARTWEEGVRFRKPQRDVAARVPRRVHHMHGQPPKLPGFPVCQRHVYSRYALLICLRSHNGQLVSAFG